MLTKLTTSVACAWYLLGCPVPSTAQNTSPVSFSASGTGRTTGHIADLHISNLSDSPVQLTEQTVYIPTGGQYQPYIATIPPVTVPPGATTVPIDGFCADVHTPAVPSGDPMIPTDQWLPVGTTPGPGGGVPLIPTGPLPVFTPEQIPGILDGPGFTPTNHPTTPGIVPTWPGTDILVGGIIDPVKEPEIFAPVLVKALENIANAYDKLKGEGTVSTPFRGDPEKEREAVIQQTFWIYIASITKDKYAKDQFGTKVIDQFEKTQGVPFSSLPQKDQHDLNAGIDVFWSTFTATGAEAKVLTKSEEQHDAPIPGITESGDTYLIGAGDPPTVTDAISDQEKFNHNLGECFFNKLEYSVLMEQTKTRGTGKNKKTTTEKIIPNEKNEATAEFRKDDLLRITLTNLTCECLCWTSQKGGTKSGTFCDCSVGGVTQQAYNPVFTDELADDLDAAVVDSLKKEVQNKLDDLKNKGGKKSEIDKLEKQLKDDKVLKKENAGRFRELKSTMEGPWRLGMVGGNASFSVPKGFTGEVEFVFKIQGTCKGDDTCKGASFSREVKIKITCK